MAVDKNTELRISRLETAARRPGLANTVMVDREDVLVLIEQVRRVEKMERLLEGVM